MIRRPPRSTRTDTSFPTRRSSDLNRQIRSVRDHPCGRSRPDRTHRPSALDRYSPASPPGREQGSLLPPPRPATLPSPRRSEEHTSELQSLMSSSHAVRCLTKQTITNTTSHNPFTTYR